MLKFSRRQNSVFNIRAAVSNNQDVCVHHLGCHITITCAIYFLTNCFVYSSISPFIKQTFSLYTKFEKFSCRYQIFWRKRQNLIQSIATLFVFVNSFKCKRHEDTFFKFEVRRRTEFEWNIASYWKELKLVLHSLLLIIFYRAPPSRLITYFCIRHLYV